MTPEELARIRQTCLVMVVPAIVRKDIFTLIEEIETLRQDAEIMAKVFNQECTDYENVKAVEVAEKYSRKDND